MEQSLYWTTSLVALVGVWLNIKKHVGCFWIWSGTNSVWVFADIRHGLYPQAALMATYLALAVFGIWKWRKGG